MGGVSVAQTRWSLTVAAKSRICVVLRNPDPVRRASLLGYVVCYAWRAAKGLGTHWFRRQVVVAVPYMCMRYAPRPRIWPLDVADVSWGRMRFCTGGVRMCVISPRAKHGRPGLWT